MSIVHVFNDQKKFSVGYFQFLADHGFKLDDHELYHYGKRDPEFSRIGVRANFLPSWFLPRGHLRLLRSLGRADRIIVHSLAAPLLVVWLALRPSIAHKVTWVVWGKDLYLYALSTRRSLPLRIYEAFRKRAIANIGRVLTGFKEDFDELQRLYRSAANNSSCTLLYPYNVQLPGGSISKRSEQPYTVLLGNSASVTNEHLEMLPKLAGVQEQIDEVIVPLSYGSTRRYVARVLDMGRHELGDRFSSLTDFIAPQEYFALLGGVDIAVFNHKRQEAFNNICTLLLGGVTVYLNDEITTARFLQRIGVAIRSCQDIADAGLRAISDAERATNISILREELRIERSVEKWRDILQG